MKIYDGSYHSTSCGKLAATGKFFANFKVRSYNNDKYKVYFAIGPKGHDIKGSSMQDKDSCCESTYVWHDNFWHREKYDTLLSVDNRLKTYMYFGVSCIKPGHGDHCQIYFKYREWGAGTINSNWDLSGFSEFTNQSQIQSKLTQEKSPAAMMSMSMALATATLFASMAVLLVYRMRCWQLKDWQLTAELEAGNKELPHEVGNIGLLESNDGS